MISAELRPCPFCGGAGKPYKWRSPLRSVEYTVISCEDCGASTWLYITDVGNAVDAWNRRPGATPDGEKVST